MPRSSLVAACSGSIFKRLVGIGERVVEFIFFVEMLGAESQIIGFLRLKLDGFVKIRERVFLFLLDGAPQCECFGFLLRGGIFRVDHLRKRLTGGRLVAKRQRLQFADEHLRFDELFVQRKRALQIGQRELPELHRPHSTLWILRRHVEHRHCEHLAALQQRGGQQLLGEFFIIWIEPLLQCGIDLIDDLVQIVERFGRYFELRCLVEVLLTLVFGHCRWSQQCQHETGDERVTREGAKHGAGSQKKGGRGVQPTTRLHGCIIAGLKRRGYVKNTASRLQFSLKKPGDARTIHDTGICRDDFDAPGHFVRHRALRLYFRVCH